MHASPRLGIDYLAPQQAQKHVTVNEGFRRLDALAQLAILSAALAEEPAAPAEGDAYILPAGSSGAAWSAMAAGDLAVFQDGGWARIAPKAGWRAYDLATHTLRVFDGTAWSALEGGEPGGVPDPLEIGALGVNTSPDETNFFAVKSDAVLFSHDDVTPGSGDMRIICNKAAAGDTASFLFQSGYDGRAEFGLAGDDDFHLKVSDDGETWNDAIVVDRATGEVSFPNTSMSGGGDPMTGAEIAAALDSHLSQTVWRTDLLAVPAARTTASETLALSDQGAIVRMNSGSAQTLTVPANSSVAFPVGAIVLVHQLGDGQVTIAAGSGVTIRAAGARLKIAEQYGEASLKKIATDEWTLSGNLAA